MFFDCQNKPRNVLLQISENLLEEVTSKHLTLQKCISKSNDAIHENIASIEYLFLHLAKQATEHLKSEINQQLFDTDQSYLIHAHNLLVEKYKQQNFGDEWFPSTNEFSHSQIETILFKNAEINTHIEEIARIITKIKTRLGTDKFYKVSLACKNPEKRMLDIFKNFTVDFFRLFKEFFDKFNNEVEYGEKMNELNKKLDHFTGLKFNLEPKMTESFTSLIDEQSISNQTGYESLIFLNRPSILEVVDFNLPDFVLKAQIKHGPYKYIDGGEQIALNDELEIRPAARFSDGKVYLGQWNKINGLQTGKGAAILKNGEFYEGFWIKGKPDKMGRFIYPDGVLYEGEVKNGKEHGKGIQFGLNGQLYKGMFENGVKQGFGIETIPEQRVYEGQFYRNFMHGEGKIGFQDGSKFKGGFFEGKLTDNGTFEWSNGEKYTGTFCKGTKHGKGIYVYENGGVYEGDFCDDYPHGFGKFTDITGNVYECFWKGGNPIGIKLAIDNQQKMSVLSKGLIL